MISWLRVAKSAYFYKKRKRIPKNAIVELFGNIRQNSQAPSNNIFRHVKEVLGGATWSAISFLHERDPAFFEQPAAHTRERVCGFLLLVEHRDYAVLFKSNIDLPSAFKTEYLQRVGDERVEAAIARADATFEKISLRNMAPSKHAMRSKTLEANDLQSVVGPASANRYIPRGYRVRRGGDHYSTVPNTGRISLRSDRTGYEELVHWAVAIVDMLIDENAVPSSFIRAFARPIDLDSLPTEVQPSFIAVDVPALIEELFEAPDIKRLVRRTGDDVTVLNKAEIDAVLAALDQAFPIRKVRTELRILDPHNDVRIGEIAIGKARISLRSFEVPEIEEIYVQNVVPVPGEDNIGVGLKRYISQNDLFTVLFNDFTIVYLGGTLYRDDSVAGGGEVFLSYIRSDPRLNTAVSEKGTFTAAHRAFDPNSVFRIVIDSVAGGDEVLVCDDLVDEWADFIGINATSQPKTISFYHAKHGPLSLGASPFHVAVSQATKNLGRMSLSVDQIAAKQPKWTSRYSNDNVQTSIQRIVKGNAGTLRQKSSDALASPDTIRRVFIVTSSLSRRQLEDTFAAIRRGQAPTSHFVQLYWLLMSYFSACAEVGAYPYVVCQE